MNTPSPVLITFDVHSYQDSCKEVSIWIDETVKVLENLSLKATFFIPAVFAGQISSRVRMLSGKGHEIGCHGLTHGAGEEYNILPYEKQKAMLCEAKKRIEDIISKKVISFRAPAFKINGDTVRALDESGFKADISVTSQRLGILTSEAANTGWLYSPRAPYHPDTKNPFRKGNSSIWEIPQSSLIFLFSSNTGLALGEGFMKMFFKILHAESKIRKNPVVFMTHPEDIYPREIKHKYKFKWNHLLPSKTDGFLIRYGLINNKDGKDIAKQNISLLKTMRDAKNVRFLTAAEMVNVLEGKNRNREMVC